MEQTAVEFFWNKIALKLSFEQVNEFLPVFEKANKIFGNQIKDAFVGGLINCDNTNNYDSEQYFEERYGK
jgi:hypothetical protein